MRYFYNPSWKIMRYFKYRVFTHKKRKNSENLNLESQLQLHSYYIISENLRYLQFISHFLPNICRHYLLTIKTIRMNDVSCLNEIKQRI